MYNYITDGATSERAFIGALATAIIKEDRATFENAFDTIKDANTIFNEDATQVLFDTYRDYYRKNNALTVYVPVDVSNGRSEVREVIDECIKTFNEVAPDGHAKYINDMVNEYKKRMLANAHERIADAIRNGAEEEVNGIKKEIDEIKKENGGALERLKQYNNVNLLDHFRERDPATMRRPIPTGYPTLDKYTNGGLRDELYIINAGTSVGKTAFTMQICDHIAKTQPVICFALEMGKTELIARSLSRETFIYSNEICCNSKYARTQTDITDFDRYYYDEERPENRTFTVEEINVVNQALNRYSKYAHNIYTITPDGELTIEDIKRTVTDFYNIYKDYNELQLKQKHPKPIYPVVIVDYLQLIAPTNERMDERRTTDECIIGLKQLARDYKATVICLSATARGNYNKEQTIDGGKNSGGIEYTAGTVFGLQFYAQGINVLGERITQYGTIKQTFDKSNADVEFEKAREPRYMELKVLKNRSGIVQNREDRIILEYNAKFHHYEEIKREMREVIAKRIQRDYADKLAEKNNTKISDEMAYGVTPVKIAAGKQSKVTSDEDENEELDPFNFDF